MHTYLCVRVGAHSGIGAHVYILLRVYACIYITPVHTPTYTHTHTYTYTHMNMPARSTATTARAAAHIATGNNSNRSEQ